MYLFLKRAVMVGLLALVASLVPARADTLTWTVGPGDWSAVENWTNWAVPTSTRVPAAGDDVVVSNAGAYVYLADSTPYLGSLAISNAYLSCSNWDTTIYATNLTIKNGGFLTCYGPFTNNAVSNRVRLTCTNLVIETGGSIYVKGKGFAGGTNVWASGGANVPGNGPGGGAAKCGGSYGGAGSYDDSLVTGKCYGSYTAPLDPGSGGAANSYTNGHANSRAGGDGGGAVCITAAQVVVNGSINANAYPDTTPSWGHAGNGSGGGIFITCTTIAGAGTITANGGASLQNSTSDQGGAGGGGRIAIIYDSALQAALGQPAIRCVASGALGHDLLDGCSDIGTLYFSDSFLFSPTNVFTGQWLAPGLPDNLEVTELLCSNAWLRLPVKSLTVNNTLSIIGNNALLYRLELTNEATTVQCGEARFSGGSLVLNGPLLLNGFIGRSTTGPTFNCTGNLTLTNGGRFYVYAGLTNTASPGYGALVNVGGDIQLYANSWIYPGVHPTNGTPALFNMRNLAVNDTNSGFNADSRGYAGGAYPGSTAANVAYGPGGAATAGEFSRGSSHGGIGGTGNNKTTIVIGSLVIYGSSNAPVDPGSGARHSAANLDTVNLTSGGGSVQIRATKTVAISGTVTANGGSGTRSPYSDAPGGGASGGGIYITCRSFIGNSNAILRANGGLCITNTTYGWGGGGGGGRIAVWRCMDKSPSVISNYVDGGVGYTTGGPGTIVWGWLSGGKGTIFTIH